MDTQTTTEIVAQPGLFSHILGASPIVLLLLLLLIAMSVLTWMVIKKKRDQFQSFASENQKFLEIFWSAGSLSNVENKIHGYASPLSRVFRSGLNELQRINSQPIEKNFIGLYMENLETSLAKAQEQELFQAESQISLLATIGSSAPFIGLLGTVIGIMNSFGDIAQEQSASLVTVAPGISEALFATAVGLVAAIPSVMAYNHFNEKMIDLSHTIVSFSKEFQNLARLEFLKGKE